MTAWVVKPAIFSPISRPESCEPPMDCYLSLCQEDEKFRAGSVLSRHPWHGTCYIICCDTLSICLQEHSTSKNHCPRLY